MKICQKAVMMGMDAYKMILFLLVLAVTVYPILSEPINSTLETYKKRSFRPEKNISLSHFVEDNNSTYIYIAGYNSIFHIDSNFEEVSSVSLNSSIENENKILLIANTIHRLVTCGTSQRSCQLRNLSDISEVIDRAENVVAPKKNSSVGLLVPAEDGSVDFYVAQTILEKTKDLSRSLCVHSLSASSFTTCTSKRQINPIRGASLQSGFESHYSDSFVYEKFSYFVTSQDSQSGVPGNKIVPKISRICNEIVDNLETFTEITLACSSGGTFYTIIKSAVVVDHQLYAVFSKNEGGEDFQPVSESALCIYNMTDLVKTFDKAVVDCSCSADGSNINYLLGAQCRLIESLNCEGKQLTVDLPCMNDLGHDVYRYPEGATPVSVEAAVTESMSFTSIQLFSFDGSKGALIGTEEGKLLKVHIEENSSAHVYETISVNSSIRKDSRIDENTAHILTRSELLELDIVKCSQYSTCDECIQPGKSAGDPFCGWCTLENRCTRKTECPMSNVTSRWLKYTDSQCTSVSSISPSNYQSIDVSQHKISLNVEQLPPLKDNESYECKFGTSFTSPASMSGNLLNCTTPSINMRPPITSGEASVKVDLHIYSSETDLNFVITDFFFYDCSKIESCIGCVASPWSCNWCVYDHECKHNSSECNANVIYGQNNPKKKKVPTATLR